MFVFLSVFIGFRNCYVIAGLSATSTFLVSVIIISLLALVIARCRSQSKHISRPLSAEDLYEAPAFISNEIAMSSLYDTPVAASNEIAVSALYDTAGPVLNDTPVSASNGIAVPALYDAPVSASAMYETPVAAFKEKFLTLTQ